MIKDRQKF